MSHGLLSLVIAAIAFCGSHIVLVEHVAARSLARSAGRTGLSRRVLADRFGDLRLASGRLFARTHHSFMAS